jgi:hypothetical protein
VVCIHRVQGHGLATQLLSVNLLYLLIYARFSVITVIILTKLVKQLTIVNRGKLALSHITEHWLVAVYKLLIFQTHCRIFPLNPQGQQSHTSCMQGCETVHEGTTPGHLGTAGSNQDDDNGEDCA